MGTTCPARGRTSPTCRLATNNPRVPLSCEDVYSTVLGVKGSQVQILSSRRHDGRCTSSELRRPLSCLSCKDSFRGRSGAARFGDLQLILSGGWWTCFWSKSGARRAGRRNVVTVCSRLLCPLRAVGGGWAQLVSLPRRRLPRVGDRLGSGQGVIGPGRGWRALRVEWLDRLRAGALVTAAGCGSGTAGTAAPRRCSTAC